MSASARSEEPRADWAGDVKWSIRSSRESALVGAGALTLFLTVDWSKQQLTLVGLIEVAGAPEIEGSSISAEFSAFEGTVVAARSGWPVAAPASVTGMSMETSRIRPEF